MHRRLTRRQALEAGAAAIVAPAIVMAGEHTEPISRSGLMNGAVRSGERAALEVLDLQGR